MSHGIAGFLDLSLDFSLAASKIARLEIVDSTLRAELLLLHSKCGEASGSLEGLSKVQIRKRR